jgi:peptidoglycan/LPS O-acetylase OafA/YrhL
LLCWVGTVSGSAVRNWIRRSGQGPFALCRPSFSQLSLPCLGFLFRGSLARTRPHQFAILRVIRIIPALAVEVTLCAILLGLLFTEIPRSQYLASIQFYTYFLNIIGRIHFTLPGVFANNPGPSVVNGQLWTIPLEMECYLALILLAVSTLLRRRLIFVSSSHFGLPCPMKSVFNSRVGRLSVSESIEVQSP